MGLHNQNGVNRHFPRLFFMDKNNNIAKNYVSNLVEISLIREKLKSYYSVTSANYIMREFMKNQYHVRYQQIGSLKEILNQIDHEQPTTIKLGGIFNLKPQTITKSLNKFYSERKQIGRPRKLTEEQESYVIQNINDSYINHEPLSPKEIIVSCEKTFNMSFTDGWLQKFIMHHQNEIQRDISFPQDDVRLHITREQCQKYLEVLINEVDGKFAELVYNADEVGCSQWGDKKNKKVIVPSLNNDIRITHKVPRSSKLQTILGCISAAGDVLTPVLIHSRKTIDQQVYSLGLREGTDVIIRYSESGFINVEIFEDWINNFFIPFVNSTRNELKLQNEEAILLCDNCNSHISRNVKLVLAQNRIKLISFPPHTSHLFQMLDLVTFGVMKHSQSTMKTPFDRGTQADVIYRNLKAFETATLSSNNRAGFLKAGFLYDTTSTPYKIKINENKVMEIIDNANPISEDQFQKLFPFARRRKFGFINKKFF